jgi:hypothetical protein
MDPPVALPTVHKKRLVMPIIAPPPTTTEQLDELEQVLAEVEAQRVIDSAPTASVPETPIQEQPVLDSVPDQSVDALAQMVPQVALQSTDTLNPQKPTGSTFKEVAPAASIDAVVPDAMGSVQYVEQEPSPELSPEVESFLERVENQVQEHPQEIVIADGSTNVSTTTHHPSQPVIVLPITPEIEHAGKSKSPHWSIRWLVEWSQRIIKAFSGQVIYRQPYAN